MNFYDRILQNVVFPYRRELHVKSALLSYRTKKRFFKWIQDEDGDTGLHIAGCLTLIKYKDSTIVLWGSMKRHSLTLL